MDNILDDVQTASIDERRATRFEGRVACSVQADGAVWACWLRDLSIDGAAVEPPIPALVGRAVALDSDDFPLDRPLPGKVVNVAHRRTCIAFDLDGQTKAILARFIDDNS
jgi:hypothetical protein